MKRTTMSLSRLAAWAGMIGSALFVGVFTLEGWLRPGYRSLAEYVSALSLGPRGWIQMTNFVIFGILLFVFTRGLAAEFPNGKASRGGLVLLTIIACCYFLSGPFVMDPAGTPLNQTTVHGTVHGILGATVFLLMPISCFVYLRRFRIDPKWQSLQWWTLALGTISALGTIALTITSKLPNLQLVFADWLGLIQRTVIVPFMVWLFVFALVFDKQARKD
jgi:hypothetical protein